MVKHTNLIVSFGLIDIIGKFAFARNRQATHSQINIVRNSATNNLSRIEHGKEVFGYRRFLFKRRHIVLAMSIDATIVIMARPRKQDKTQVRANATSIGDIVSDGNRRSGATCIMPIDIFSSDNRRYKLTCRLVTRTEYSQRLCGCQKFFGRDNQVFRLGRNLRKLLGRTILGIVDHQGLCRCGSRDFRFGLGRALRLSRFLLIARSG